MVKMGPVTENFVASAKKKHSEEFMRASLNIMRMNVGVLKAWWLCCDAAAAVPCCPLKGVTRMNLWRGDT